MQRKTLLTGALIATIGAVGGGIAMAAIPGTDGQITACVDRNSGNLRVIDAEAGATCRPNESPLAWSATPTLGCPDGTTMSTGVCIETTPHAPDTHPDAEDECAAVGRRLPSPGELTTFAATPGITLSSGEWTDDVADINRIDPRTGTPFGDFSYFVVADPGNGVAQAFDDYAYRCVTGAIIE